MEPTGDRARPLPEPAVVQYGGHPSQFLEVWWPDAVRPHPVVVLIHGGFWRLPYGLELMRPLAEDLVRRGFAVANLEYRRLGEDGGGWPGTFDDVAEAFRKLGAVAADDEGGRLDLDRVGVVGHSAGGQLALWAASAVGADAKQEEDALEDAALEDAAPAGSRAALGELPYRDAPTPLRVRAVVSLAGVADLRAAVRDRLDEENGKPPAALELMGGEPDERPEAYRHASPIERLPISPDLAQLLVHGDLDNRVPISQSLDYQSAARAAGDAVELARFPTIGHFELIDPGHECWSASVTQLTTLLYPGA